MERFFWLDVDAGIDDAQGLLLLLAAAKKDKNITLGGLSCVFGNVEVLQVANNVAKILTLSGTAIDVPVYVGASRPLVQPPPDPSKTNLALACRLDDSFALSVGHVSIMGGSTNHSAGPEFNFKIDPEAARICLESFPLLTLVTWECGLAHPLPWATFYRSLTQKSTIAKFMQAACKGSVQWCETEGYTGFVSCDLLAAAVALNPNLITASREFYGVVELGPDQSEKGKLRLVDNTTGEKKNVVLVEAINMAALLPLYVESLAPPLLTKDLSGSSKT